MGAPAPLISIDQAPAPPGGAAEWFEGADGARLRAAWFPRQGARGSVVLSPGRTEPMEKYFEVVGELLARGFGVLVHDWRGQGLSQRSHPDRLRGHAQGIGPFLSDHARLLDAFEARMPRPWIELGHSMGGGLALLALARGETRVSGAILTAPMLGVPTGTVPKSVAHLIMGLMLQIGRAGECVAGAPDPLTESFEGNLLTHDRARYERYKAQLRACPDLALGGLTWGWLDFALALETAIAAPGALEAIDIPVTLLAAGSERIVLASAIQTAARRLPRGRYEVVPGAMHEILMETDGMRALFWRAFDQLVADVSPPPS